MPEDATAGSPAEQQWALESEATALVELFNDAVESYSPDLEWFAMSNGGDREEFVFEAEDYVDRAGLDALRERGRTISYVEAHAHEHDDKPVASIHVPVEGSIPDTEVDDAE